jgi:hypothetical protein
MSGRACACVGVRVEPLGHVPRTTPHHAQRVRRDHLISPSRSIQAHWARCIHPTDFGSRSTVHFSIIFSRKKKDKGDKAAMGCATSSASASTRDEEEDVFEVGGLLALSWLT